MFTEFEQGITVAWPMLLKWQFIYLTSLTCDILYTYAIAYFLIPRYLNKKRRLQFALFLLLLTITTFLVSGTIAIWHYQHLGQPFLLDIWLHVLIFMNSGPIMRCGIFLFVKALKTYYERLEEHIALIQENGIAELQLLKAQVHPHFLFNTLNNIYSFALNKSPVAGKLITKLSSTLNYMTNDCEAPLVPLEKELKFLEDYLSLEKVRYGNRLDMHVEVTGTTDSKLIAPLLMIPFVENSFKHGASKVLEHPRIDLKIAIARNMLKFDLFNTKPENETAVPSKSGLGLINVQKRLQLLYPGSHDLKIEEELQGYNVRMVLPLQSL